MNNIQTINTHCLIVGGGVAGLKCSDELAALGFRSLVLEKSPFLGGHAIKLVCKATTVCQKCGACLVVESVKKSQASLHNSYVLSANLGRLRKDNSTFEALVFQEPLRIFPERCDACGECLRACPIPGAIRLAPVVSKPYIVSDLCVLSHGASCAACAEVCPRSAIDLSASGNEILVRSSAVVIATGFQPFNPEAKPRLGYGRVPGVLTALELEKLLRNNQLNTAPNGKELSRVAFIQCVGSRDVRMGHNYCSQVCCAYALRLARLLKSRAPGMQTTMFYMDIQTFERDFQRRLEEASEETTLRRAIPSEVRACSGGGVELLYHGLQGKNVWEAFDLVILSVGMSPPMAVPSLEFVGRNGDGFLGHSGDDCLTDQPGIFVAGAAQGPKSIKESINHAVTAAGKVAAFLKDCEPGAKS